MCAYTGMLNFITEYIERQGKSIAAASGVTKSPLKSVPLEAQGGTGAWTELYLYLFGGSSPAGAPLLFQNKQGSSSWTCRTRDSTRAPVPQGALGTTLGLPRISSTFHKSSSPLSNCNRLVVAGENNPNNSVAPLHCLCCWSLTLLGHTGFQQRCCELSTRSCCTLIIICRERASS